MLKTKLLTLSAFIIILITLTACSNNNKTMSSLINDATSNSVTATSQQQATTQKPTDKVIAEPDTTTEKAQSKNDCDIDLTVLNSNLVYSQVYNMVYSPEKFIGKTIKMRGKVSVYQDTKETEPYYAIIISDAMACCQQGLEFKLDSSYKFPDDYPKADDVKTILGVFTTYKEKGISYCKIADSKIVD